MPAGSLAALTVQEVAEMCPVRECLQWFTREKQWVNEIHLALARIPAPTFLEHQRAEWMAAQFRGYGCEVAIDRAGNVVATPGRDPSPSVALTAHLDTVLAPRSKEDIAVDSGGLFRGPGVSDNGAGLAGLLAVARALRSVPSMEEFLPGLVLLASVGEEGEGNLNGMRHFCSHSPYMRSLSTFLVLDGAATAHITTRAIGSRRYEVSFTGPGGHSWSDYGVPNPVHALSRAIALFTETRLNASPRSSINVGVIEGGASVNSIPPLARAKIDIRSECNQQIEALSAALQSAVERSQEYESQRSTSGRLAARIREIGSRPAGVLDERSGLPATLKYVDAHLGIRSHFDCASTDANIPLARGIPAVSIGAGGQGGGAHTAQEWFSPEGRDLGLKRILLVLCMRIREAAATGR